MKAVLQRVTHANVVVEGELVSEIEKGFLILLGVDNTDTKADADVLSKKISGMRVFEDENGKMNRSAAELGLSALVVSNFTLCADTKKGNRPSYFRAAGEAISRPMYEKFVASVEQALGKRVATGEFGADMKVALVNDGPVTIWIDSRNKE